MCEIARQKRFISDLVYYVHSHKPSSIIARLIIRSRAKIAHCVMRGDI